MQEAGVGYVFFAVRHEAHFRVMFSAELADRSAHPSLQEASAAAYDVLADAIARCQEVGAVRGDNPANLSRVAWSLVHGLAMLLIDGHLDERKREDAEHEDAEHEDAEHEDAEHTARRVTEVLWVSLHGS